MRKQKCSVLNFCLLIRKYHVLWLKKCERCKAAGAPPQTPLGELCINTPLLGGSRPGISLSALAAAYQPSGRHYCIMSPGAQQPHYDTAHFSRCDRVLKTRNIHTCSEWQCKVSAYFPPDSSHQCTLNASRSSSEHAHEMQFISGSTYSPPQRPSTAFACWKVEFAGFDFTTSD